MFKRLTLFLFGTIFSFAFTMQVYNFAKVDPVMAMVSIQLPLPKFQETPKPVATYTKEEYNCLHENIYHEARNQSPMGQVMVGIVTIMRTKMVEFPNSICGVVYQQAQFSWTLAKKKPKPDLLNPIESQAWWFTGLVAKHLLVNRNSLDKNYANLAYYHSVGVKPYWSKAKEIKKEFIVGDHIFYSKVKDEAFSLVLR